MDENTLTLGAKPPFSLPSTVRSHGWWQLAPFGWDPDTGTLTYLGQLGSGQVIEIRIREAPGGVSISLSNRLTPSECQEVEERAAWMLGLSQDLVSAALPRVVQPALPLSQEQGHQQKPAFAPVRLPSRPPDLL